MKLAVIDDDGRVFIVTRDIEQLDFLSDDDDIAHVLGSLAELVGTCDGFEPDGVYTPESYI